MAMGNEYLNKKTILAGQWRPVNSLVLAYEVCVCGRAQPGEGPQITLPPTYRECLGRYMLGGFVGPPLLYFKSTGGTLPHIPSCTCPAVNVAEYSGAGQTGIAQEGGGASTPCTLNTSNLTNRAVSVLQVHPPGPGSEGGGITREPLDFLLIMHVLGL